MSKLEIVNLNGEKVKDIKLNDNVFGIEPNDAVLHNAIVKAQAGERQGTHSTKTRSEVRGGGRKPWRQKGTGNARQGSIRAVQWVGGGIAFGPKPRDYSKKQNRKERRLALLSALSYKANDNAIVVVENLELASNKTKEMVNVLSKLNLTNNKVLVVVDELNENLCLAARNLANVQISTIEEVNTFDVVAADNMLVTASALAKLEEVLGNE